NFLFFSSSPCLPKRLQMYSFFFIRQAFLKKLNSFFLARPIMETKLNEHGALNAFSVCAALPR
ncbi:hypothetical protein, partial [Arenibacter sp. 6A1]|uniref:hypothetical protein n=1 Tax=Arenibacter sp. 6A1 TaxID=2720391 RepID=UPI00197C1355